MQEREFPNIARAEEFSKQRLAQIRNDFTEQLNGTNVCLVTTGSFARRDASENSDLDYLLLNHGALTNGDCDDIHMKVQHYLVDKGLKQPSKGGAFADTITVKELTTNIGGFRDSNKALTHRMLILLECDHLLSAEPLKACKERAVERYVNNHIQHHNMIRFFLNDLIRYHKTIAVDFEFKTSEDGKSWGIRNIKLLFSRNLLYFSGILVAAESIDKSPAEKRALANNLFSMTPRARIEHVCGENTKPILRLYDQFLGWMADPQFRAIANRTAIDRATHEKTFRDAKRAGQQFSDALYSLLRQQYPAKHPIHRTLVL